MFTRNIRLGLVLLIPSAATTLLAVEIALRFVAPQPPIAEWFARDPRYGFFMKQNFHQAFPYAGGNFVMEVSTNSLGLRDIEPKPAALEPGKTILLIGDSFVFGYGVNVDQRIDTRLRAALNQFRKPSRVINAGVPGWGTRLETQFARDHFADFQPDVIALVFCANDPDNDQGLELPVLPDERSMFYRPKMFLRQHSHAYRWLLQQVAVLRHARRIHNEQNSADSPSPDAQSGSIITPEEWERTLGLIRAFHAGFLAFNPEGVLILLAADPTHTETGARFQSLDNWENLLYLDLGEGYARLAPEQRVTPWDRHWGPAVHQLAADALFDLMIARGLLGS